MNFWFCETCGKRLTDKDLAEGGARDKKLKGMYCQSCSVGIMTMEMDAITLDEVPNAKRKTGGSGESRIPVRRTTGEATLRESGNARRPSGESFQRESGSARRPSGESFQREGVPARKTGGESIQRESSPRATAAHSAHPAQPKGQPDLFPLKLAAGVLIAVIGLSAFALLTRHRPALPLPASPSSPAPAPVPIADTHTLPPATPVKELPPPNTDPDQAKGPESEVVTALNPTALVVPPEAIAPPASRVDDTPSAKAPTVATVDASKASALPKVPETNKTPAPEATAKGAGSDDSELMSSVIRLLSQHRTADAIKKATGEAGAAENLKPAWQAVLGAIQKEEKDFQELLNGQVGKEIKLQTAKESVEGKVTAVDFPLLRVEKSIGAKGETLGTTIVAISAYDLTEASRQMLYHPDGVDGDGWAGRVLLALGAARLADAESAYAHLSDHALKETLASEIKRQKSAANEIHAQAAWTSITGRVKNVTTQSAAKQLTSELDAFEKTFAGTEFIHGYECGAALKDLKERLARLSTGLDPRITSLFKGRILSYEAQTGIITLEYDFSSKPQTEDFEGALWAPPGDHTGLTWTKGKLLSFHKDTLSVPLTMPQFVSNTIKVQVEVPNFRVNPEKNLIIDCGFYKIKTMIKSPRIRCQLNGKTTCSIMVDDSSVKSVPSTFMSAKQLKLEFACQDKTVVVKINGQTVVEHTLDKATEQTGFWLGGGWDSGVSISRFQISGRLDPVWLANALKAAR